MKSLLATLAQRLIPGFAAYPAQDRIALLSELLGILLALPFVAGSLLWLANASAWPSLVGNELLFALLLLLAAISARVVFFQSMPRPGGQIDYTANSLEIVFIVAAFLLLGPAGLWVAVISRLSYYLVPWRTQAPLAAQLNRLRNMLFNLGPYLLTLLLMALAYALLGGQSPFSAWSAATVVPAALAIAIYLPLGALFLLLQAGLQAWTGLASEAPKAARQGLVRRAALFFVVSDVPAFLGLLAAGVMVEMGLGAFLLYAAGILLAGVLARRLSQQAMRNGQRSRELVQLERLGRALLAAPPTGEDLPDLLAAHLPGAFAFHQLEIRSFPEQTLLHLPAERLPVSEAIWRWLEAHPSLVHFEPGALLPWSGEKTRYPLTLSPIVAEEEGEDGARAAGGIALVGQVTFVPELVSDSPAALRVLGAQIASAMRRTEVHHQILAHQRVAQELEFAAQIQASFLPASLPVAAGWELSAFLRPSQRTSGDFYDVFTLRDGRLALVIADVAGKGTGAALFMAVTRTLLRTHTVADLDHPGRVLANVNRRIMSDTRSDLFVTVFLGILDPRDGLLHYANAGHNPPYLFPGSAQQRQEIAPAALGITGIPLGVLVDETWSSRLVRLQPGNLLLLYTDGITDAHNQQKELFGERRLQATVRQHLAEPVALVQEAVIAAVDGFAGTVPQFDDLTLFLCRRAAGDRGPTRGDL